MSPLPNPYRHLRKVLRPFSEAVSRVKGVPTCFRRLACLLALPCRREQLTARTLNSVVAENHVNEHPESLRYGDHREAAPSTIPQLSGVETESPAMGGHDALHVVGVATRDGKIRGDMLEDRAHASCGSQSQRVTLVELGVVPVHLREREDLGRGTQKIDPCTRRPHEEGSGHVHAGVGAKKLDGSARVNDHRPRVELKPRYRILIRLWPDSRPILRFL